VGDVLGSALQAGLLKTIAGAAAIETQAELMEVRTAAAGALCHKLHRPGCRIGVGLTPDRVDLPPPLTGQGLFSRPELMMEEMHEQLEI